MMHAYIPNTKSRGMEEERESVSVYMVSTLVPAYSFTRKPHKGICKHGGGERISP